MVNVLNFKPFISFGSQIKSWLFGLKFTKYLQNSKTGKTLIKLLLQKQSDLGLHHFSIPFWRAKSVQSFRTFTVHNFY